MRSFVPGWIVASALFAGACGDSSAQPDGGGGSSSDGGGGAGGGEPGCPVGSHEDENGACAAELGEFKNGPPMAEERDHHMTWIAATPAGRFLYAAGGWADMDEPVTSIERARLKDNGGVEDWQTLGTTANVSGAVTVSQDQVVVFAGGYRGLTPSTKSVDVITIDDDGVLSDPVDGPFMNDARFHGAGVLVNGFIFATGGLDSSSSSLASVERASLDGTNVGSWQQQSPMLEERSHHGLASDGQYLFVTGGLKRVNGDFANDLPYDTVLRAEVGTDGTLSEWSEAGTMPISLAVHSSFVHAGMLYLAGGLDNATGSFVPTIYRVAIGEGGVLGEWELLEAEMPRGRGHSHQTPLAEGMLYSVGGHGLGGSQTNTFFARFE